jgi:hypothetical protein
MVLVSFMIAFLTDKPFFMISAIFFMVCLVICLYKWPDVPEKTYKEKVEAVEKANRELEIFLIEHPEFREE